MKTLVHAGGIVAVTVGCWSSPTSAWARGGEPAAADDPVARGVDLLHEESFWDRERPATPAADQRQKTWLAASFAVVVPNPGESGVLSLAVSDPGASGPKSTKREGPGE